MSDLVEKQENEVQEFNTTDMLESSGLSIEDLGVPRLYLQQAMSQGVSEGKSRPGEFFHTVYDEVVGTKKDPVIVIPVKSEKYWIVKKDGQFVERLPGKNKNEYLWKEPEKGIERTYHHAFFFILASDVEKKQKGEAVLTMPAEYAFRSTATKVAQKLAGFIFKDLMAKKPMWATAYALNSETDTNKAGQTYHVPTVKIARPATKEEQSLAAMWFKGLDSFKDQINTNREKDMEDDSLTPPPIPREAKTEDVDYGNF